MRDCLDSKLLALCVCFLSSRHYNIYCDVSLLEMSPSTRTWHLCHRRALLGMRLEHEPALSQDGPSGRCRAMKCLDEGQVGKRTPSGTTDKPETASPRVLTLATKGAVGMILATLSTFVRTSLLKEKYFQFVTCHSILQKVALHCPFRMSHTCPAGF